MSNLLCLFAAVALAQEPAVDLVAATPGDLVSGTSTTTNLWATADTKLRRTPAADGAIVGDINTGDKVQLVVADGDQYRVLRGTLVGWVAADMVSQIPPAPAGGPGGIQLGGATPLTAGD
ncbi:MAG: SH3 domain-containing protein [Myxococcota bacterium]|nr:SH3 domain-containing protein [Myxococcota bacterium]